MEQLFKSFGIEWQLLLWQVINFAIVFFILSRFLYKPIKRIMEDRERKVADSVRGAEELQKRSNELEDEFKKNMTEQRRAMETMSENTRKMNEKLRSELRQKAEEEAARIIEEAKTTAREDKAQILASLEGEVKQIAFYVASKLLEKEVDEEKNKELIERALQSLKDTQHAKH